MHAVSDPSRAAVSRSTNEFLLDNGTAPILICLFGGLSLFKQGAPISSRGGARTELLLLSLALAHRRGVTRERLLAEVWPEGDVALPSQSLHSLLHTLHRLLGDAIGDAMPVVHEGEIYRLNFDAGIPVDVIAFDVFARRGDQAWHAGLHAAACDFYRRAAALYRGDLHACGDESAVVERERLRAWYLVMLARLADAARREGDYTSAIDHASLVLRQDAGREDAHCTLMASYAQPGQRVQAMRQYGLCERILRDTFDAVPEPATRALYDRLRISPGIDVDADPATARMTI